MINIKKDKISFKISGRRLSEVTYEDGATGTRAKLAVDTEHNCFRFTGLGEEYLLKKNYWEKEITLSDLFWASSEMSRVVAGQVLVQSDNYENFDSNVRAAFRGEEGSEEIGEMLDKQVPMEDVKQTLIDCFGSDEEEVESFSLGYKEEYLAYFDVLHAAKEKAVELGYVDKFLPYMEFEKKYLVKKYDLYRLYRTLEGRELGEKVIDPHIEFIKKGGCLFRIAYKADGEKREATISLVGSFPFLENMEKGTHNEIDLPTKYDENEFGFEVYNK